MSTTTSDVDLVGDEVVGNVARAALLAALTGAFAYVSFPNPLPAAGVPVTLQVLGVFLAGIFLGPVWGGLSLVFYLAAGALGAPVFASGSAGFEALVGSSAGYLWSYPVAAAAIGLVVHDGLSLRSPSAAGLPRLVGAMVLGTGVIYAMGVAGLMLVLGLGLPEAFAAGAASFIPAEVFKIAAAVGIVRSDAVVAE
ncbi:biotin transporter BioY [Salinirubellus salinus]|uniref:Biotin transporter BioY n=1 Tax=Salinirubellus salinus TaxID=1364945 RepID=A0A9E7R1R6_9EURY|nr:biotin transporter BioY [Salinirubellus salinus]UWM54156.1 biotin transporter BioY [Salinirubellus salinus]